MSGHFELRRANEILRKASAYFAQVLGYVPPVEFEETYYRRRAGPANNGFAGSTQSHDLRPA